MDNFTQTSDMDSATNLMGCAPGGNPPVISHQVPPDQSLREGMPNFYAVADVVHAKPMLPRSTRAVACQNELSSTCSIECQTDCLVFSPLLTMELIPLLSHQQAVRELRYFRALSKEVNSKVKYKGGSITRNKINDVLHQAVVPQLGADIDNITTNIATCHELINNFSRVAERLDAKSRQLSTTIDEVTAMVHDLREKRLQVTPSETQSSAPFGQSRDTDKVKLLEFDITNISSICDLSTLRDPSIPFIKFHNTPAPIQSATIDSFDTATDFTHDLGNRMVSYYGEHDYVYSGIVHKARDISINKPLAELYDHVKSLFPEVTINSALVQKYSGGGSYIPLHSDNEPSIVKESAIISVSLGSSRTMHFVDKGGNTVSRTRLNHGDIMVMSRRSQDQFRHHIPRNVGLDAGCRISITFRNILNPCHQTPAIQRPQFASTVTSIQQPHQPHSQSTITQSQPHPPPPIRRSRVPRIHQPDHSYRNTHPHGRLPMPKPLTLNSKILFVSDSIINRTVDQSKASLSTIFRLAEFLALDSAYLSQFHTVVISTGINDLSRYDETCDSLYQKLEHSLSKILEACSNTTFIFRGLLDTDIGWLTNELRHFNTMVFDFALRYNNLWYYDPIIVPAAQKSIERPRTGGLEADWTVRANGVHIKSLYARVLAADLLLHAKCLALRSHGSPHHSPPSVWPLRPFFRLRQARPIF